MQAKQEARQQYAKRQAEKFERLEKYSLDEDNKKQYAARGKQWKEKLEQNREKQLEDLEKQFADITEGYSYEDFVKDFGSVEEGFEGAEKEEIEKAKEIVDKIKELRGDIKPEGTIKTKDESVQAMKAIGIEFKENSASGISRETANKYADFIVNFEQSHAGYFVKNESQLKSIAIVDKIEGQKNYATGIYRSKTKTIEIKSSGVKRKQSTMLSRSDDFELHGLAHEYGHYIAESLEENLGVTDADIVQRSINKYFDGDIFKSPKDLKDCLSAYGSTNYGEAFAEAFAEAYTCTEPGEFAKIFKAELENTLNTGVVKSKDSGIIEMYRKGNTHRKIAPSGKQIIDEATYHKIINPAIKAGADIRIAEGEYLEHIRQQGTAVTLGDIIYFTPEKTVSDVLEEVHHFYQNKKGLNNQYGQKQREILNEIDAKEYLLNMVNKYNIPLEEIEETKQHLKSYKKQMEDMKERGEWID